MKKLLAAAALAMAANAASAQGSVLHNNAVLKAGEGLNSDNGAYQLAMQVDGHLVLYRVADRQPIWYSGQTGFANGYLHMQRDRNLVVHRADGSPAWNSRTWSTSVDTNASLKVTNAGNIELRSGNTVYWSTVPDPSVLQTYCYPGQPKTAYAICLRPGESIRQTSWYEACSYREAADHAARYSNAGAIMNECLK